MAASGNGNAEKPENDLSLSDQEEDDSAMGDEETSGNHVNDLLNRPDDSGCVLVNVGHPAGEPDIHLAPQLAGAVKPHQVCWQGCQASSGMLGGR